jgi:hypothetical protein
VIAHRAVLLGVIVLLCAVGRAAETGRQFVIISDVDDTVKITNVLDRSRAVRNAFISELAFAGMSELYRQMLGPRSGAHRLRFISGSPRIVAREIHELLSEARFPAYKLTVRGFRESRMPAFAFKTKRLNQLYGEAGQRFILIGDDTESDPEVYAAFAASRADQILAIYIRRVTGRPLPAGQTSFVTAYDIAIRERLAERLSDEQAAAVGRAVLSASARTLLPEFQLCPTSFAHSDGVDPVLDRIRTRLSDVCAGRGMAARPGE